MFRALIRLVLLLGALSGSAACIAGEDALFPGTGPLTWEDDPADRMVAGIDRFLSAKWQAAPALRERYWEFDRSTSDAWRPAAERNRDRLKHILGMRDPRTENPRLELNATSRRPAVIARTAKYWVQAVRWPAFADVHGEGLLLTPTGPIRAEVIAIPDADTSPESLLGLVEGTAPESQFPRELAEQGCRVLVPALISRRREKRNGRADLTDREYVYRSAFELGRHLLGYEVLKVQAAVDAIRAERSETDRPLGVIGWGEGGLVALYAGAVDERLEAVAVSGAFGSLESTWSQPIDRNVFGLWERFGDAELAALVYPRALEIEAARGPELVLEGNGGAPGELATPALSRCREELKRAGKIVPEQPRPQFRLSESGDGTGPFGSTEWLSRFLNALDLKEGGSKALQAILPESEAPSLHSEWPKEMALRSARQLHELDRHNQQVLRESPHVRERFMAKLDTSSLDAYEASVEPYREVFARDVIGRWEDPRLAANPRSRPFMETEAWRGYEVALDVFPEVFAYGLLLVPKNLNEGERRPVVVCQHGLEGRPITTVTGDNRSYHDFAARLCERGFIVFAPQNPYIFGDRFRTLQRKSNPLGRTLFSTIVAQHAQIVDWLGSLPIVDRERIGFYGLSYGGKSAMRIPPLVPGYCLSICSADFNEWVDKNASTRNPRSYMWTGEYEIFEFDLGSTFNYAEMAALICPRPFMVERGHFDGVADDWTVAHEFAKVRLLYQGRLGLEGRSEIEWFTGPHTIHEEETFAFLHKHLNWPAPVRK